MRIMEEFSIGSRQYELLAVVSPPAGYSERLYAELPCESGLQIVISSFATGSGRA